MPELKLRTVTRTQGNNKALKDRTVRPRTCEFEFVEVDPLIDAFRRMVRGLEFDVSEMAMTTYVTARAHGKRLMGLPIFLVRAFHHGAIVYNTRSGIKHPKDLEGRKVALKRGTDRKGEKDGGPRRVRRIARGDRPRDRVTAREAAYS